MHGPLFPDTISWMCGARCAKVRTGDSYGKERKAGILAGSFVRLFLGFKSKFVLIPIIIGVAQLASIPLTAQVSAREWKPLNTATRPCKIAPDTSKPSKEAKKNGKKRLGDVDGCLEVRSTTLDVQEYLQAYGREQKWNLSDEHVAEDVWTFSRKLERDELLRYTQNDANTGRVNWSSGLVFVQVKTAELDEGFVRVQIAARFQGYGQSLDRFAPQKEFWPLSSNGSVERQLISALEIHFKNAQ
jgi:hypothetical protein